MCARKCYLVLCLPSEFYFCLSFLHTSCLYVTVYGNIGPTNWWAWLFLANNCYLWFSVWGTQGKEQEKHYNSESAWCKLLPKCCLWRWVMLDSQCSKGLLVESLFKNWNREENWNMKCSCSLVSVFLGKGMSQRYMADFTPLFGDFLAVDGDFLLCVCAPWSNGCLPQSRLLYQFGTTNDS